MKGLARLVAGTLTATVVAVLSAEAWAVGIETRHSGTVIEIDRETGMLKMREMVTWNGPGTGILTRSVRVTGDTSMQLVMRDRDPDPASMPGFQESPITLTGVHDGDFITITTRAGEPVAVSLEVYRPDADLLR